MFPILDSSDSPPYSWNRVGSAADLLEYAWSVTLSPSSTPYQLGAYLFKRVSAPPSSGNLNELVQAMQHSVFIEDRGKGGKLAEDMITVIGVDHDGVYVYVSDPHTMNALFGGKPLTASFEITMPDEGDSYSCKCKVNYE